jgi:tetratricopeptide (TPR) repeat protein
MSEFEYINNVHKGLTHFNNKEFNEAIASFSKAAEDMPENGDPYYLIAQSHEALARIDEEDQHHQLTEGINNNAPIVIKTENMYKSLEFYIKAINFLPHDMDLKHSVMNFCRGFDFLAKEDVITLFDKWLEYNEEDYDAWSQRGDLLLRAEDFFLPEKIFNEAKKSYQKVIEILEKKYEMGLDQMILNIRQSNNSSNENVKVWLEEHDANILINTIDAFIYIWLYGENNSNEAVLYALKLSDVATEELGYTLDYLFSQIPTKPLSGAPGEKLVEKKQRQESQFDKDTELIHSQIKPLIQFERSIKTYIAARLALAFGKDWWYDAIASNIRAEAERRKKLDVSNNPKAKNNPSINYIDLDDAKKTINFPRNWNGCFREDFKSIETNFNNDFDDLIRFRNTTAGHPSRSLTPEEDEKMKQIIERITSCLH